MDFTATATEITALVAGTIAVIGGAIVTVKLAKQGFALALNFLSKLR